MKRGISEIFCDGTDAKGQTVAIYRALRQIFCSACGTPIPTGGLFTRKAVPGFGLRILPRCARCAPFEVKEAGGETKSDETKSEMIENLLSPEPEAPEETTEGRRDLSEEAARRLGPALSRSRRKPQ